MPILSAKPASFTLGVPETLTLDKAFLAAHAAITDSFYQDHAKWENVTMLYVNAHGQPKSILFNDMSAPSVSVTLDINARSTYVIHSIVIRDTADGEFSIDADQLTSDDLDLVLPSEAAALFSFDFATEDLGLNPLNGFYWNGYTQAVAADGKLTMSNNGAYFGGDFYDGAGNFTVNLVPGTDYKVALTIGAGSSVVDYANDRMLVYINGSVGLDQVELTSAETDAYNAIATSGGVIEVTRTFALRSGDNLASIQIDLMGWGGKSLIITKIEISEA